MIVPSMHSALLACIQGRQDRAKGAAPLLVTRQAACVSRSLSLLDLYTSFAADSAVLLQLLTTEGAQAPRVLLCLAHSHKLHIQSSCDAYYLS